MPNLTLMNNTEVCKLLHLHTTAELGYAIESGQALSDMLNGRKIIKIADVIRLSEALGVSPNDLFAPAEERNQHAV